MTTLSNFKYKYMQVEHNRTLLKTTLEIIRPPQDKDQLLDEQHLYTRGLNKT